MEWMKTSSTLACSVYQPRFQGERGIAVLKLRVKYQPEGELTLGFTV